MDFDAWFDQEGYDEQHRAMFRVVWDAAQENDSSESPIYLSPEEREEKQRALNSMHRGLLDTVRISDAPSKPRSRPRT